uniref:Xylanolytic transcriptional activator regulatory domain-containing protein n=1 Tax=Bionectria ochroleuca TaxID=29856 RepID=A0A8H7TKL3_BIOOC
MSESEAGSDRSDTKRDRTDGILNVSVDEAINVDAGLANDKSLMSPTASVRDSRSHELDDVDDACIVSEPDHFTEPPQTEGVAVNAPPIDPLLANITFDNDDMPIDFDAGRIIPTPSLLFGIPFETTDWLNCDIDQSFTPLFLQNDLSLRAINDTWFDQNLHYLPQQQQQQQPMISLPTPASSMMDQSAVAELYSRSHSPSIDKDAVEPREYLPVAIEVDAQLTLPDLSHLTAEDVDQENLAHVDEISEHVSQRAAQAVMDMQNGSNYPRFRHVSIPPTHALNAWVQLYFEYFHPILPILHKSTFSSHKQHWLLVFTVAAIGAQFSSIPEGPACSRAMHEICEHQNSHGRELWMSQTILLNHIGLRYGGERRSLEIAEFLQALPVTLGRRKRLFTDMFPMNKFGQLQLPRTQKWQIWLLDEERRRAGFAIWLVDSAFDAHFDLPSLMNLSELQISLPQPDDCWNASTAQCWASFSNVGNSGARGLPTMERVIADDSWRSTWSRTNTLGKQVMLQYLSTVIKDQIANQSGTLNFSCHNGPMASSILTDFLALVENDEGEQSVDEAKASTTHQMMALTALMTHNAPIQNLLPIVVRDIYGKFGDSDQAQIRDRWKSAPRQGRLGCFYAARILHIVRSSRCSHFGAPVWLLRAVLALWLYSTLVERFPDGFLYPHTGPAVVLGPKSLDSMGNTVWIDGGWSRVKLPGIGNLLCAEGRIKLLDDAVVLMKSLKGWGISTIYAQILLRLRAKEAASKTEGDKLA